ncbi:hypothetical protein N8884_00250 [Pelagibacteraceae bacterium]|nr:hypothetical protein [Pelagibacteraceae bacterium]
MNFLIILIVAAIAIKQLPNESIVSKKNEELKSIAVNSVSKKKIIEPTFKPEPPKQEVVQKEVKPEPPKQEVVQKEVKPEPPKQEIVQKEVKPEPPKQEKINQEIVKSNSLIEKAVNYFSQYYLIGLILAAIAYIYFRTRKKITLKEILNREEFKQEQPESTVEELKSEPAVEQSTTEEFKPEPPVEQPNTEELKPDSQLPESSDEEEKK